MTKFKRSSFCGIGACVEVAHREGQLIVRNSTEPERSVQFSREEWESFLKGAQKGEFDFDSLS